MLTLAQAAVFNSGTVHEAALIEQYPRTSQILRVLPFDTIAGNSFTYRVEDTLPGVQFRGVNEGYSESTGHFATFTESLKISGGDLDVDLFIIDTQGAQQRRVQELMKVKSLALYWTKMFFKGDAIASQQRQFDGLQNRIVGQQLFTAGANGAALSINLLEEAIDSVDEPSAIFMPKALIRRMNHFLRTNNNVVMTKDQYGNPLTNYRDIPLLPIDKDETNTDILGFNETVGSSSLTASIYIVSFGADKLYGIQGNAAGANGISVRDIGELQTKPAMRTRVEWYSAYAIKSSRAVARIRGVLDAAVVA
jgi:hypothetical protein